MPNPLDFTSCRAAVSLLLLAAGSALAQPVRLHPDNPHYYEFRGRPFVVVTSAEHYGALL
ncbi:MAG: hypothetical protein GY953_15905, partial [bacterium]|nr:hypothetical protein [bacterium]